MKAYEIAIAQTFQRARAKLTPTQQAHVNDAVIKQQAGHSVHLHALTGNDYVAFDVSQGALRIICMREADTLLLVYVDTHDAAYVWCDRHQVVQIGHVIRVVHLQEMEAEHEVPEPRTLMVGPLAGVRDRTFRHFEVGPRVAEILRRIPDDDALIDLSVLMPPAVGEALLNLATSPDEIPRVLNEYRASLARAERPSLGAALSAPINSGDVWLPPGEKALRAALDGGLDGWRVFLHPSQRRLVEHRGKGALKITGGPGTGKSVVALHRARYLASARFEDDARPVLLTAFNRALCQRLDTAKGELFVDAPERAHRVQVRRLVSVAQDLLKATGAGHALLVGADVEAAWADAISEAPNALGWRPIDYENERVLVETRGAWTVGAYLKMRRPRHRSKLSCRADRKAVWAVLSAFEAQLLARGGGDLSALARRATTALNSGAAQAPWAAVVCDEAQDATPDALRLLAALTRDVQTGAAVPDGLFLCADGYQRLYERAVPLSSCGIEIRGRSKRLRLNYRTTEAIRAAAVAEIEGVEWGDVDADDALNPLEGYRSLRTGPKPDRKRFSDVQAEAAWLAELVQVPGGLLVLTRTRSWLKALKQALLSLGHRASEVGDGTMAVEDGEIVLCTLHGAKGLEAPRVVLAGSQESPRRWPGQDKGGPREAWYNRERSLRYVGITRARDWCGISSVG